jgi:CubicO group peptidase (beta-lactamase class C family)
VKKGRKELLLWLAVLVPGGILLFVGALWTYMIATATPLYQNLQGVPATAAGAVAPRWAAAVESSREIVRDGLVSQNVPGVSVAVGVNDALVWSEGFGWADLDSHAPVTPDMRFRIGTSSKALTSAAVGLLVEDGRLALDDDIRKYVPEFPEKKWPVTVRQLMGQVSGVHNDSGDEGPYGQHCEKTLEALALFADDDLLFEPGTHFRNSSFGWILVSAAVEAAGGQPFADVMRARVFERVGMTSTQLERRLEPAHDLASFYFPRFAADPKYGLDPHSPIDLSCYVGAKAYQSTAADMTRFGLAINNATLMSRDTVSTLETPLTLPTGESTGYGLGWAVSDITLNGETTRLVASNGESMGGPPASLLLFPDRHLVVAVLANTPYTDAKGLALKIAEAFIR